MKNIILAFAFLFVCGSLLAQSDEKNPTVDETLSSFVSLYQLDDTQQVKMLEIQERKFRNLGEIENLKTTDPAKYQKKIEAMQYADRAHMHQLLNEAQLKTYRQRQVELRQKKANVYKEMRGSGTSQSDIEERLAELDLDALLNG